MLCLVMHSAGGILVWLSSIMSRGDICCTQGHDGDDPFYIREFHILMRTFMLRHELSLDSSVIIQYLFCMLSLS